MSDIVVSDAAASEPPAPNYCDPKITGAVEEAFEAVWAVIKANDQAGIEIETDCERRVELSRKLAELVGLLRSECERARRVLKRFLPGQVTQALQSQWTLWHLQQAWQAANIQVAG